MSPASDRDSQEIAPAWRQPTLLMDGCAWAIYGFGLAISVPFSEQWPGGVWLDPRIYAAMTITAALAGILFYTKSLLSGEWLTRKRLPWINFATASWLAGTAMGAHALIRYAGLSGQFNGSAQVIDLVCLAAAGLLAALAVLSWKFSLVQKLSVWFNGG